MNHRNGLMGLLGYVAFVLLIAGLIALAVYDPLTPIAAMVVAGGLITYLMSAAR